MKNMYLYYSYKFSFDFMLIYPLYALMLQSRGMSESAIAWLFAIWALSVVLLEIPMGVLGDRVDRKKMLLASTLVKAAAMALWIPLDSFMLFAAGFILWGLSEALNSGTEQAWLYETLTAENNQQSYLKVRGRGQFWVSIAIAGSSILGGYSLRFGFTPVLYASILVTLIAALLVSRFASPPRCAPLSESEAIESITDNFADSIKKALNDFRRSGKLLLLLLFGSSIVLVPGVLEEWDPIFLSSIGITPLGLGIWLAARYLCESIGSMFAHRAERFLPRFWQLLVLAALASLPLAALGFFKSLALLPLYAVFYALYAMLGVQIESRMQDLIDGSRRATVLSFRNLLDNVLGIVMIIASGYLAEARGWDRVWIASSAYIICGCLLLILFLKFAALRSPGNKK